MSKRYEYIMHTTGDLNVQQTYVKMFNLTIGNAIKETI